MTKQRLQNILAAAGVASRRGAEELIASGRVRVNGRVISEPGTTADQARDRIEVDGRVVTGEAPLTVLLNKPRGVVCTASDPEGRETIVGLVRGTQARLFPVGRLDCNTSGAILLTNDGDLANALTHPRFGVEKTYVVKLRGQVSPQLVEHWRRGVEIGDPTPTRSAEVFVAEVREGFTWLQITIKEGRNRQVRRMAEATGVELAKLKRVAFAGLTIEGLRPGEWRPLTTRELSRLL
ncbi:MAG TPA: pseudouridine synthase, partial [Polyangia bacterium]|nr:pseudouridine synthase [Polyangia bacterium]